MGNASRLAIGMVELNSIARGIETCDYMVKAAQVDLIRSSTVCPGKYMILIAVCGGYTAVPFSPTQKKCAACPSAAHFPLHSYFRPPRRELLFSVYFISDSLLSEACMKCLSRSSKDSGSLGCLENPPDRPPPCRGA